MKKTAAHKKLEEKSMRCLELLENLTLAAERHDPTEIEHSADAARQFLDKDSHE